MTINNKYETDYDTLLKNLASFGDVDKRMLRCVHASRIPHI
jgi:hypothetical protein